LVIVLLLLVFIFLVLAVFVAVVRARVGGIIVYKLPSAAKCHKHSTLD